MAIITFSCNFDGYIYFTYTTRIPTMILNFEFYFSIEPFPEPTIHRSIKIRDRSWAFLLIYNYSYYPVYQKEPKKDVFLSIGYLKTISFWLETNINKILKISQNKTRLLNLFNTFSITYLLHSWLKKNKYSDIKFFLSINQILLHKRILNSYFIFII